MDKIKLKNCPFCGGEAYLGYLKTNDEAKFFVECSNCENTTKLYYNKGKAAEAWNRRVN